MTVMSDECFLGWHEECLLDPGTCQCDCHDHPASKLPAQVIAFPVDDDDQMKASHLIGSIAASLLMWAAIMDAANHLLRLW